MAKRQRVSDIMSEQITIKIKRYVPDRDITPHTETYQVPYEPSMSLLDALAYIKDDVDSSLSYRWSCRMQVCGSCGMVVNGVPKLACDTFLRDYYPNDMVVDPLSNFPVERDLIVDQSDFLEKLEAVKPFIVDAMAEPSSDAKARAVAKQSATGDTSAIGVNKQTPKQLAMFKQYSMCINCLLCYSACPQFGLNPQFVGPSAIALAHRYNKDSRDHGHKERMDVLNSKDGVWSCTFVGYCSTVCPKGVDPAAAIQQEKMSGAINWALTKVGLGK